MPRDRDFKRHVRARMQKTGEAYTTARKHLLDKAETRRPTPADESPLPVPADVAPAEAPDYAGIAGMRDATIEAKTGRTWKQWVITLDEIGAARMEHRDIARFVSDHLGIDGWWAQTVTVGYERIRGLRERGQRRGGSYEANKTRTFAVPVTALFDACADEATRSRWLTGQPHRSSAVNRPRSIRLRWHDDTLVAFWFTEKASQKSTLAVQHSKLPDRDDAERMKEYWADRLTALGKLLNSGER
jgi:uncharacterized protein YndB with AHSA1/START domain